MNKAKAMLDALMGPSRDVSAKNKANDEFKEKNSCKHYLIGCCPNAMLGKKMEAIRRDPATFCICPGVQFDRVSVLDPEGCHKLHSLGLRTQFNEHPQSEKYRIEYEEDLCKFLEQIIQEVEKKTTHEKKKREEMDRVPETEKMCDICGMRYKLKKKEYGIEVEDFHSDWDVHKSYVKLREKLAELQAKQKERDAQREEEDKKKADAKSSDTRDRSGSRKDTRRDIADDGKEGGARDRSRSRKGDGGRDREGGRGRDRDGGRDGDRDRRRSGSRRKDVRDSDRGDRDGGRGRDRGRGDGGGGRGHRSDSRDRGRGNRGSDRDRDRGYDRRR